MSTTVGQLVQAVRLRHPAYDSATVPTRVLVEALGRIQRWLGQLGVQRYSALLRGRVPILLDLSTANQVGTVAASSTGGLPATTDASGAVDLASGPAGSLATYDIANATVVVADFVPNTATSTTVTKTGAGRTVNADAGLLVVIVAGPGAGEDNVRAVVSNTADTWTVAAFATTPVAAQSVVRLVQAPAAAASSATGGAVTRIPATQESVGYLIRLDATGTPYLDLAKPLVATVRTGIPLPPHDRLLGLDALRAPTGGVSPLMFGVDGGEIPIYHQRRRFTTGRCAWVEGDLLFLNGPESRWSGIASLELRYVPIPPLFDGGLRTVTDEYLLLPDTAYPALVAHLAAEAAMFAQAKGIETVDAAGEQSQAEGLTMTWLTSLSQRAGALRRVGQRNR